MRTTKRLMKSCSLLLAFALTVGCIPAIAFADDGSFGTDPAENAEVNTDADGATTPDPTPEPDPTPAPDPTPEPAPDPSPYPVPDPEPELPHLPDLSAGWNLVDGNWYYGNTDGTPRVGWLKEKGSWYWLIPEENGRMAVGWANAEGSLYRFNNSGVMQTGGWKKIGGTWYYLHKSGAVARGWLKSKDTWYYLNSETGAMATGWLDLDGTWYYLNKSGAMVTGWKKIGGVWYHLNKSGAMATGWKKLEGTWYYLKPENGAMKTGWLDLDGTWYYLKSSGAMVTGSYIISGSSHLFSKSGVWQGRDKVEELFTKWAQPESSNTKWLILVDTKRCKVGVFYGSKNNWTMKKLYNCAPGKSSTPTVKGRFTVGNKGYYFDSGSARCFYFTQFRGNYLFHSVLYYQHSTPSAVMDGRVGQGLSHGCVRLELANAKWIYDNIPRGTKVYVW